MTKTTFDRTRAARSRPGWAVGLLLPVMAVLALGACTSGGDTASPTATTADPDTQALKFTRCMREHGVDMPDPEPGGGIRIRVDKGQEAKVEAAQKACREFDPMGDGGRRGDPQNADHQLRMARCLREQGIDAPDPEPGEPMRVRSRRDDGTSLDEAMRICEKQVPAPDRTAGR